jgi:hypothetical protein
MPWLSYATGRLLLNCHKALEQDPTVEIVSLSEALYQQAIQLYAARPDKERMGINRLRIVCGDANTGYLYSLNRRPPFCAGRISDIAKVTDCLLLGMSLTSIYYPQVGFAL